MFLLPFGPVFVLTFSGNVSNGASLTKREPTAKLVEPYSLYPPWIAVRSLLRTISVQRTGIAIIRSVLVVVFLFFHIRLLNVPFINEMLKESIVKKLKPVTV
jgi:hypothetical protein